MKGFIVTILALCLLAQSFGIAWVVAGFYHNQDYYSHNECILKYEIVNTCKGTCILIKKIHIQQEQEQKNPDLKLKETLVLSLPVEHPRWDYSLPQLENRLPQPSAKYINHYAFAHSARIFHPPVV